MQERGFPRSARLLSGADFKRVFQARRALSNQYFRIHHAPQPAAVDSAMRPSSADDKRGAGAAQAAPDSASGGQALPAWRNEMPADDPTADEAGKATAGTEPALMPGPRIGLAIAKRVARRAVDRNRIRRQARETFRLHRHHLPAEDFVVLAKPAAADADKPQLRQALNQLWNRF
ncbi:MAG: ribonuclease P protein component [Wenzhouxiangellaceae bacterium]|nr:ribonuclease P protein component [Wenzhouxiangellaceae bacterium]